MKAAIAMSGGVDSSVAAYLMMKNYAAVFGVTFVMQKSEGGLYVDCAASGAKAVCEKLAVSHTALDASEIFNRRVISYFTDEYLAGRTPNPCVECNRYVKFPLLLDFASSNGCDRAATGHYAQIEMSGSRILVKKAADITKDQSYVLWQLTQEQLSRICFPLGRYTKREIREIATENNLPSASSPESQDICFVPDGDYAGFIEKYTQCAQQPGLFLSPDAKVLGTHRGHIHYTIGQRRRLGIALGHHVFVTGKDAAQNTVTLGDESFLYSRTITAQKINIPCGLSFETPYTCTAKVRYQKNEYRAEAERTGEDELTVHFQNPVRAPAPGQSLVLYDGDLVIAGGIIKKQLR